MKSCTWIMQLRSSLVGATTYRRVICPDDRIPTDEPIDGQRALVHELSFARQTLETWRLDYNAVRPHSSLNNATPTEFGQLTTKRADAPILTS